ncbi:Uncharacterized protein BP5553_05426 [Venustampulla echinocandica]|uniref:Uncharacterized protein n=1 Tax=Venustampulla echinocandica TaxID=2656787 RepID=A0A370TR46_9HELO|nr:Uncharacterized protein BP5553_05426 [Venustampulla echinocandica]RDL37993.1 Uncharacterized protein BP5553_05426 [Venustampulla echinocandica]
MPTPAFVPGPGRMIQLPENGYETPRTPKCGEGSYFLGPDGRAGGKDTEAKCAGYTDSRTHIKTERESPRHQAHPDCGDKADPQQDHDEEPKLKKFGIRDRIGCYTWTWFTMTMATGGVANVLHTIPYQPAWLGVVGVIFFVFNLILFIINCVLITLRFRWNPGSFKTSFTSQSESLFIPACVVSVGTILINVAQYGIPNTGDWLQTVMQVCYWAFASVSFISSSGMYLIIWSTQTFPIHTMTPIWIFPAYPLLLLAPFAANLIQSLPDAAAAARINSVTIALGAVAIQGTGFLFVSVGPSGFTVAGLVLLGSQLSSKIMPNGYMGNTDAPILLKLLSEVVGLWIWGLCLWFFIVSVGAHWRILLPNDSKTIRFDMTWFSFVFPNTALVTATLAIDTRDCLGCFARCPLGVHLCDDDSRFAPEAVTMARANGWERDLDEEMDSQA